MPYFRLSRLMCALLASLTLATTIASPVQGQLVVTDPLNLIQTALNAARSLEQINNQVAQITNQVQQLENDARNLTSLDETFAPELMAQLREMDQLIAQARGVALRVAETREALEVLYSGDYHGSDVAGRAQMAARQIDAARSALQTSLLVQARASEQLRQDQTTLQRLSATSANAIGTLSATQATNEILAFQTLQSIRLQQLLVATSRAEALERARDIEVRAQGAAQREHFFSGARSAHSGQRPWN